MQKKIAFILLALAILPFVLGTLYFQYVSSTGGQSTTNYGTLVSPMKQVDNFGTEGFWTFVIIAKQCEASCKKRLLAAETTRVLTNENMQRVRTVFIGMNPLREEDKPTNVNAKIHSPFTTVVTTEQWQKRTASFALSEQQMLESILLIDPRKNFMMLYPKDKQDPKKMLKDMKRLLKYSRIG